MKKSNKFSIADLFLTEGDKKKNSNEKSFKFIRRIESETNSLKNSLSYKGFKNPNAIKQEIDRINQFFVEYEYLSDVFKYAKVKDLRKYCVVEYLFSKELLKIIKSFINNKDNFIKNFIETITLDKYLMFEDYYVLKFLGTLNKELSEVSCLIDKYSAQQDKFIALETILFDLNVFNALGFKKSFNLERVQAQLYEVAFYDELKQYRDIGREVYSIDIFGEYEISKMTLRDLKILSIIYATYYDELIEYLYDFMNNISNMFETISNAVNENKNSADRYYAILKIFNGNKPYLSSIKNDFEKNMAVYATGLKLIDGEIFDSKN